MFRQRLEKPKAGSRWLVVGGLAALLTVAVWVYFLAIASLSTNDPAPDFIDEPASNSIGDNTMEQSGQAMVKPASPNLPPAPNLSRKRPAPDFDNQVWINSPRLSLTDLRGKVVLVEFWTFGCINCQNVQPALKKYYETYASQGLEIVAFHAPEFDYEKKLENVQAAVKERGLKYPVAIDNDFKTWNKYGVRAWPTMYLVDKQGQLRYSHIGEGQYDQIEAAIVALLNEK